jgi:choline dehydrogenase
MDSTSFDFIIIGAGSAGCVIANRLSSHPGKKVLLMEAGMPDRKPEIHIPGAYTKLNGSSVDWSFWTEPQEFVDGRKIYIPRGRTLGGSSSTNAMAYVRGSRYDFDEWASLGNEGWSYEDVLPYFKRSENNEAYGEPWHGKGGPLHVSYSKEPTPMGEAFIRACEARGIPRNEDHNGAEQFGASMLQFTIKDGRRHSSATAFLKPVTGRPNLTVKTGCRVTRILLRDGRAVGVEYRNGSGLIGTVHCSGEVILSAGAIQSPQILLLSGIGDADALHLSGIPLKNHLPGVGQNLQDHVWSGVSSFTKIPTGNTVIRPLHMFKALLQHLLFRSGPLAGSPLEANAFLATDPSLPRPDIQFHMAPIAIDADYRTDMYDLGTYPRKDGYSILGILLRPESRGYVGLRSPDPLDAPLIQPNFLSHPSDMEKLVWALRKCLEVSSDPNLAGLSPAGVHIPADVQNETALRSHIRKSLETLYHPVGTCKMGRDDMAVVDPGLRVHGIAGLRVADASVMPTIVSGNTNAATIMIGEKAAELILPGSSG